MNYPEALAYLASLSRFGIQLGLERIETLLELMDHPERCYKTVHITGTNGKGSTSAMLASILRAGGIKTGLYTSPHLEDYTERMTVNGHDISRESFAQSVAYTRRFVEHAVAQGMEHPTEFEVLTAAAFYFFAEAGVEYAVIEVGLGGLYDSTNVILPEVSVITNVTLEHTDKCGPTVLDIARHKAGIIKAGKPVVTAAQGPAGDLIASRSAELGSALYLYGRDIYAQSEGIESFRQKITIQLQKSGLSGTFITPLLGRHQVENAALAIMTAQLLAGHDPRISVSAMKTGMEQTVWPGRFEVFPGSPTIVVDGAHNPDGARILRAALDEVFPQASVIFVFGVLADKDIAGVIRELFRPQDRIILVKPYSERAAAPESVAQLLTGYQTKIADSLENGLQQAGRLAGADQVICVAGSLYLIGSTRQILRNWTKE
ncbi:bifunctional folylpolyglutamate synthase/dihydrofolate synthase [Acetonema longum]|uniref:tetrahydrofolate synthase n=1 Tax=Acetonema longum DSM 6540 TaxID=1009370 RepID=F7NHM3_9FIRM|nr:folylpolyglutamate synthase/dihydrofolate synthase family protein [Acetonema longum]EGO64398.1 FolC bifunctional protein [Acetonema longum DSM 6540]